MKKIYYVIYFFAALFIVLEIGLRTSNIVRPGVFQNFNQFQIVDSLYQFKNYTTDEKGIYKFSSWVTDSIYSNYNTQNIDLTNQNFSEGVFNNKIKNNVQWEVDHLDEVLSDFKKLELGLLTKTDIESSTFASFTQETLNKPSFEKADSLILSYLQHPFNEEGFRSIPFDSIKSDKPKVLLIGDSFTYGQSASPLYNSFADILLSKNYIVYNTGISGTDPCQYAAVAKKYVPLLKPDIIIVNFCIYNDMMNFYRIAAEDKPHEYITNAGFYTSHSNGKFYSMEDAYELYKTLSIIPQSNVLNRLMSQSSVLTLFWSLLHNFGLVKHPLDGYFDGENVSEEIQVDITLSYLNEIVALGDTQNIPVVISFMPDYGMHFGEETSPIEVDNNTILLLMSKIEHHYPSNFYLDDFVGEDDFHFNNKGSEKYANYLDNLIKTSLINED